LGQNLERVVKRDEKIKFGTVLSNLGRLIIYFTEMELSDWMMPE